MFNEILAGSLEKALRVNSDAVDWNDPGVQDSLPTGIYADGVMANDGAISTGGHATVTGNNVWIMPFCAGSTGSEFFLRLWGWRDTGKSTLDDVGLPFLLVELRCVAGTRNGIGNRKLAANEFMAETIELTKGSVGKDGEIYSPTADGLDNGIAFANVCFRASKRLHFQFKQGSAPPAFGNAFLARY